MMTEKEKKLRALLERALYDLVEHKNEYQHKGDYNLLDEIKEVLAEK
jgi:hypothetical protein